MSDMQTAGGFKGGHELDEVRWTLLGSITCRWCCDLWKDTCPRNYPDAYASARAAWKLKPGDSRSHAARVIAWAKKKPKEPKHHWVNPGI